MDNKKLLEACLRLQHALDNPYGIQRREANEKAAQDKWNDLRNQVWFKNGLKNKAALYVR